METATRRKGWVGEVEAAEYLGHSRYALRSWRQSGRVKLPYAKLGRSVRYSLAALEEFLAAQTING